MVKCLPAALLAGFWEPPNVTSPWEKFLESKHILPAPPGIPDVFKWPAKIKKTKLIYNSPIHRVFFIEEVSAVQCFSNLVFSGGFVQCVQLPAEFVQLIIYVVHLSTESLVLPEVSIKLPLIVMTLSIGCYFWVCAGGEGRGEGERQQNRDKLISISCNKDLKTTSSNCNRDYHFSIFCTFVPLLSLCLSSVWIGMP